jgi:hypothetical protein
MNSKEPDTIFEYLILGSGAGGATAFLEFASESTLLLEEGTEITRRPAPLGICIRCQLTARTSQPSSLAGWRQVLVTRAP